MEASKRALQRLSGRSGQLGAPTEHAVSVLRDSGDGACGTSGHCDWLGLREEQEEGRDRALLSLIGSQ